MVEVRIMREMRSNEEDKDQCSLEVKEVSITGVELRLLFNL